MNDVLHKKFHDRVEFLTGERWCPYPSNSFMWVVLNYPDDQAVLELIEERRTYFFPTFLAGDPQAEKLSNIIESYDILENG